MYCELDFIREYKYKSKIVRKENYKCRELEENSSYFLRNIKSKN